MFWHGPGAPTAGWIPPGAPPYNYIIVTADYDLSTAARLINRERWAWRGPARERGTIQPIRQQPPRAGHGWRGARESAGKMGNPCSGLLNRDLKSPASTPFAGGGGDRCWVGEGKGGGHLLANILAVGDRPCSPVGTERGGSKIQLDCQNPKKGSKK